MKTITIIFSIILMTAGLGCVALSSYVTPADVDTKAVQYVVDAGIAELNDYKAWYPNLALAERLVDDLGAANLVNQQSLQQLMDKDNTMCGIYMGVAVTNRQSGRQREEAFFSEAGLLPMGMSMLGVGGFAGLLGLMRKRPGDITKPEMEQALATVQNKTTAELTLKEKQMIQLVRGVQAFLDSPAAIGVSSEYLKAELNKAQDNDTRVAVSVIKTSNNI